MLASIVQPGLVDQIWPSISEGMVLSCSHSNLTAGYLWQECRSGHAFLVVIHEGTDIEAGCVVRFENEGHRVVLRGLALSGSKPKAWLHILREKLNEMAKEGGASVFVDEGRQGLVKLIEGARIVRVVYEVDVK